MSIATQEKIADFVQNVKQMATEAVDKVCIWLLKHLEFNLDSSLFFCSNSFTFFLQLG